MILTYAIETLMLGIVLVTLYVVSKRVDDGLKFLNKGGREECVHEWYDERPISENEKKRCLKCGAMK